MRKSKTNPLVIEKIRCDYMERKGTIEELSNTYGISYATLKAIAARNQWTLTRNNIGKERAVVEQMVGERSIEKASSLVASQLQNRIATHLDGVFKTGSTFMAKLQDTMENGMALGVVTDAQGALALVNSYSKADSIVRRSLGLADSISEVAVSGSIDVNAKVLGIISSVRNQDIPLELPDDKSLEMLAKRLADESKS